METSHHVEEIDLKAEGFYLNHQDGNLSSFYTVPTIPGAIWLKAEFQSNDAKSMEPNHSSYSLSEDVSPSFHSHPVAGNTDLNTMTISENSNCESRTDLSKEPDKQLVDNESEKKFLPCSFCNYSSVDPYSLRRHIMTKHTIEKPQSCSHCDFSTNNITDLKRHITTKHTKDYSGDKFLPCSYCNYSSVDPYSLRRHIMSKHTVDKPLPCSHCDYSTTNPSVLRKHVIDKHTIDVAKEKFLPCSYCSYSCVDSYSLKRHITTKHAKEKSLSCTYCEYKAEEAGQLKKHIMSKHKDEKPLKS